MGGLPAEGFPLQAGRFDLSAKAKTPKSANH
jgi:hypothetical protein